MAIFLMQIFIHFFIFYTFYSLHKNFWKYFNCCRKSITVRKKFFIKVIINSLANSFFKYFYFFTGKSPFCNYLLSFAENYNFTFSCFKYTIILIAICQENKIPIIFLNTLILLFFSDIINYISRKGEKMTDYIQIYDKYSKFFYSIPSKEVIICILIGIIFFLLQCSF